jgi:hypothetical protein
VILFFFANRIDGFEGERWFDIPGGSYTEVMIDPNHMMPELYRHNNNIRKQLLFHKADRIRPQLMMAIEDPAKRTLIYMPAINWTRENGFMIGLALNNGLLIPKPIEYYVMPFYSFNDPGIVGLGKIAFNIMPYDKFIRMATISFEGAQFGAPGEQNYHKAKAGLDISFRTRQMIDPLNHKISASYFAASDLDQIKLEEKAEMRSYVKLGYSIDKTGLVNPFSLSAGYELNSSYQKATSELNYRYSYRGKNSGLDMRLFVGAMIKDNSSSSFYAFSPAGRSGREQYLYQGTYPDRFGVFPSTLGSRQMTLSEGGLASPVSDSLGYSNWLISLSFTSNLPGKASRVPVKPFINFLFNDHGAGNGHNSPFFYEAGLKAGFWNIFEIYVPLVVSGNIESLGGSFKNRIRIILNLDSFVRYNLVR